MIRRVLISVDVTYKPKEDHDKLTEEDWDDIKEGIEDDLRAITNNYNAIPEVYSILSKWVTLEYIK